MAERLLPECPLPENYAQGLRAGIVARAAGAWELARVLEETAPETESGEREFDPLACLHECAREDRAPDTEERACLARHGWFYLGPEKDGFDVCIAPPVAPLEPHQLRELAALCQLFANGSVEVTADGAILLRTVSVIDAPEIWRRLTGVGLRTASIPPPEGESRPDGLPPGRWLSADLLAW